MATSRLSKNSISAFEEYGVQLRKPPKVEVISTTGPPHKPIYTAVAMLGDEEVCKEEGFSKHEARIKAAERALHMLTVPDSTFMLTVEDPSSSSDPVSSDPVVAMANGEIEVTNPIPDKDPVSALMEFSQASSQIVTFNLLKQEGPPHMPVFTMSVTLGNETYPEVKGNSAKKTKKDAACVALQELIKKGLLQRKFKVSTSAGAEGRVKQTKIKLGIPGKNPVSVLNEYAQKISKKLTFEHSQDGPPHRPKFKIVAVLGEEKFPEVEAMNKKEGNVLAAQVALEVLEERGEYLPPKAILGKVMKPSTSISVPPHEMELHDRVATVTMTKLAELLVRTPESLVGRKVVAAIVMTDNNNNLSRVVSLGTGNRCVHGNNITDDGTVLHDSHAEILAKRGFKRYLYSLLVSDPLCLLNSGEDGKFRFKPHITFHLFISVAPCGDGALFVHSDGVSANGCRGDQHNPMFNKPQTQALMRAKQENGEGTVPIKVNEAGQTYDGIVQGGRLRIMSCSDKICMWNVTGLQGALLSQVFQPIYLKSITFGNLFNAGHLSRALCCRIDYNKEQLSRSLPLGYHVNHPDLGVPTSIQPFRGVEKARSYCMNWNMGDSDPEITDGSTGLTLKCLDKAEQPSRLCKRQLLTYHRSIISDKTATVKTYKMYKLDADDYNRAKEAFRERMKEQKYGSWIRMPQEIERFTVS